MQLNRNIFNFKKVIIKNILFEYHDQIYLRN